MSLTLSLLILLKTQSERSRRAAAGHRPRALRRDRPPRGEAERPGGVRVQHRAGEHLARSTPRL